MKPILRSGVTLLEVMASLALVSVFMVGAQAWMLSMVRLDQHVSDRDDSCLRRALACIEDDLDAAMSIRVMNDTLESLTAHHLPGDDLGDSGWLSVSWKLEDDRIIRSTGEEDQRVILIDVERFEIDAQRDHRQTLRLLDVSVHRAPQPGSSNPPKSMRMQWRPIE